MKAVYEATYAVPELGIEVGDTVLVEPAHPRTPLLVVKGYDRGRLPSILEHLDDFTLRSCTGFTGTPAVRRSLLTASGHGLQLVR